MDAGTDAGADAGTDAGTDAGSDAGTDAGLPPLELFATIGGTFVRIDTATGDATEIGPTGLGPVAKLAFEPTSGTLYGIIDYLTLPRLVTVDPCTGAATLVGPLTAGAETVFFVSGFDHDPTAGSLFVTGSIDGPYPADSNEEHLLRLDPATAMLTSVGDIVDGTTEIDGDAIAFSPTVRLVIDVDPSVPEHVLWDLDVSTGAATGRRAAPLSVDWVEFHDGVFYGSTSSEPTPRNLVTLDPATGVITPIGPTHTAAEFDGSPLLAMSEARALCP
jgi:hypothetical protein